jgi:hypothetical protein
MSITFMPTVVALAKIHPQVARKLHEMLGYQPQHPAQDLFIKRY